LETWKILDSKSIPEQNKEKCWSFCKTWLQIILQSHSNKNSMVLAQKWPGRSKEQYKRYRNKLI
jgi:hypothetical protein